MEREGKTSAGRLATGADGRYYAAMSGGEYTVLINDAFKKHLDGLGESELDRIREKLEFLGLGLWDSGLRVKKLKGSGKSVVFEARISKGDRLLFTLGRDRGKTIVYAWGIEGHDDVGRATRSILPENAPFLSFEPLAIEDREELVLDDLSPDYFSLELFDSPSGWDCGPQRWRVLDDSEWRRLIAAADRQRIDLRLYLTEEQRQILEQPPPLFLSGTAGSGKTTIAVYYLLRPIPGAGRRLFVTNHRYLCAWSQRLYEGLANGLATELRQPPPQFSPYRDLVRKIIEAGGEKKGDDFDPAREVDLPGFERMLRDRKEFSSLDPELAWEEIRGVIKGAKPALNVGRYRGFVERFTAGDLSRRDARELEDMLGAIENLDFMPRIESVIQKKTSFPNYGEFLRSHSAGVGEDRSSAALVHRYILESLEKKAADLGKPLLSFSEYQALGRKRAPRFSHDRTGIYAAAEWYQSRLKEGGLWDEIDLTRRALEVLAEGREPGASPVPGAFEPWDLIVCDEAQDFTNVHLYLLFRLVVDPSGVVMAGDVKQIINPSGFRWADLRALFWERGLSPPDLFRLSLNFRSVGGIVVLGNALLDLKKRLVGIQSDESKETWKFSGRTPCILTSVDKADLEAGLSGAGAGSAIVVRDDETRERLKGLVKSELVFTVAEAKGLEFDAVLLWKLTPESGDIAGLWRRLAGDEGLAKGYEARIVHEINLFYVAVTRARNSLVIYEENLALWNQSEFAGLCVRSSDPAILRDAWKAVSTPDEWRVQGDYYFEREYWKAATECFRNAGDAAREALATGLGHFADRRFAEAAGLLEAGGLLDKAALAYEESGDPRRAAGLWNDLGETKRYRRSLARALEKEKDFVAAAAAWLEFGDKAEALRNLARSGDNSALGDLHRARKDWEKAAKSYAACRRFADEAESWRRAGDQKKAADAYFAGEDWEKAARYYLLSRQYSKIPECWQRAGRYDKAVASQIQIGRYAEAAETCRRWIESDRDAAERLRAEAGALAGKKPMYAAVRYMALGEHGLAGKLFQGRGENDLALHELLLAGDHKAAAASFEAMGDFLEAASELERENPGAIQIAWLLERFVHKDSFGGEPDRKRVERLIDEGRAFESRGDWGRAVNRYVAVDYFDAARRCFLNLDRDDEALRLFGKFKKNEELATYIREKKDFRVSPALIMIEASTLAYERFSHFCAGIWPNLLRALERSLGEVGAEDGVMRKALAALLPMKRLREYEALTGDHCLDIVDFLVRIGHLNGLSLIWSNAATRLPVDSAYRTGFRHRIEAARSRADTQAPWFAALLSLMNREEDIERPSLEELGQWNSLVYAFATKDVVSVIKFYGGLDLDEELEAFGEYFEVPLSIAIFADLGGKKTLAAKWFAKTRAWDEALRCYREAGDEKGVAKMLEKTGTLEEALAIWTRLASSKDIARVNKAIASGKSGIRQGVVSPPVDDGPRQLDLFS